MAGTRNFERIPISGAADGVPILVAATSSPGTTIHTATSETVLADEIFLWAYNDDTVDRILRLEWGGTGAVNRVRKTIPFQDGLYLVIPGLILRNSLVVKAWADATNVIALSGFVNRGIG